MAVTTAMTTMSYAQAAVAALQAEMQADPRVVVVGEDVAAAASSASTRGCSTRSARSV